jgi:hypothetical protein
MALVALGGVGCFGLGVLAAGRFGATPASPPAAGAPDAGASSVSLFPADAGAGPRIMIDPDSIQLLPDASLRLQLPPGFDAGER